MFKVKVENLKQLEIVLSSKNVSEIILSRDSFAEDDLTKLVNKIKKTNKLAWILMERISRYEENMKPFDLRTSTDKIFEIKNLDGIIIQNLDSFAYMLRKINRSANQNLMIELNYTMNCYNDVTKKVLETLYNEKRNNATEVPLLFTAPLELNTYELSEVGYDTLILYSYIDTMVSANCLKKNLNLETCINRFNFNNVQDFSSYIIDRKGKKLYFKTYCKYCYNKIFNTDPLFLLDKIEEIKKLNILGRDIDAKLTDTYESSSSYETCKAHCQKGELCETLSKYRIDFSFENEKEVKDILSMKCPNSFTRGHYKNTIK